MQVVATGTINGRRAVRAGERDRWRTALRVSLLLIAIVVGASADEASAQRGVQQAPDGRSWLVGKDVGGERWAISRDVEDGTVVGNVFRSDGSPPQFLWCWPQSTADDPVRLRCSGTTGCDEWTDLGEIELPASFLAPPTTCEAATSAAVATAAVAAEPAGSALRMTPDERRILISKDVAGLRWALTYDAERLGFGSDHAPARLTGNVFDPAGGPARFVSCAVEERNQNVKLRCSGADACGCAPCGDGAWTPLPDVVLPASFLNERRCPAAGAPRPGVVAEIAPASADESTFGAAVALAGRVAAVAARDALYVYEQDAAGWQQVARITGEAGARYARGVAIDDGTIAVGDDHRARLYRRDGAAWGLVKTLSPSGVETGEVAAMADGILVQRASTEDDRSLLVSYRRDGDSWRKLDARATPGDFVRGSFGAVAVSGARLAATVTVQRADREVETFVQLYDLQGDFWQPTVRVHSPSSAGDDFGRAIALSADTLVVGEPPRGARAWRASDGAVHVYALDGESASLVATLRSCSADLGRFGSALALSGDRLAVAASAFRDGDAAGDLHLFARDASGWHATARIAYGDVAAPSFLEGSGLALDGASALVAGTARAYLLDAGAAGLPPARACPGRAAEQWPGADWSVESPVVHGMNPVLLDRARAYAMVPARNTQAVVVVRHGVIVAEWYAPDRDRSSFAGSWSSAKSVAATVIGLAIDRGDVAGVDASMASFYPDWSGTAKEDMSLRHVLTMTSGLDWTESFVVDPTNTSDLAVLASSARDQLGYVLAKPLAVRPGTRHEYSSADSMMLSGVIEAAVGRSFADYAQEVLFAPLGMTQTEWWSDAVGHTLTYCCVDAPSRDFARFGLLWARGGRWRDRQMLSSAYVHDALTSVVTDGPDGPTTHGYGFQWWLSGGGFQRYAADAFQARGYDGQYIYVYPTLDLVVVRNGRYTKDPGPPIADPNLFARYPAAGLGNGRGTVPPDQWDETLFLDAIVGSIVQ